MDWKGLLKWSINYQDGTVNKDLKPLSQEDAKFIESAMESVCINEMKEIMKILDIIKNEPESNFKSEEDIECRCEMLENLLTLLDGVENARNIVRSKRFPELIKYFFETKEKRIKIEMGRIITSMMQNDKLVQSAAIDLGIFRILEEMNTCEDIKLSNKYIYMLTGLLYGEYEKSKKLFLEKFDGMKLIHNILIKNYPSAESISDIKNASFKRALDIIQELTKIEEKETENYLIRGIALEKIKEIELHNLVLKMINTFDYSETYGLDIIQKLLNVLPNIAVLFESLEQIFKSIEEINKKLNESTNFLTKEHIDEEKKFLIHIIKNVKLNFISNSSIVSDSQLMVENNEIQVDSNNKLAITSAHIQLKR